MNNYNNEKENKNELVRKRSDLNSESVLCSNSSNNSGTVNPASSTSFEISLDSGTGTGIGTSNSEYVWNFDVLRFRDRNWS